MYNEKELRKSAVKHSYKALMFTYRKERTPFMQRKKGSILLYQTYEFNMELPTGIEPASSPWEGEVLPLNDGSINARISPSISIKLQCMCLLN